MSNNVSASEFSNVPDKGRLLGVDFGTKRVGLAISTLDQTIASPLLIHQRSSRQADEQFYRKFLEEHPVVGLVVGLPMHVGGAEGQSARAARAYGDWLSAYCKLPIDYWDERYTSAVAEEFMIDVDMPRAQRKKRLDMVAAQIMLQSFLNERIRQSQPPPAEPEPEPEPEINPEA